MDIDKLSLASSPHTFSNRTIRKIMYSVVLSLLPAVAAAIYYFGWRAVMVILSCMVFCVLIEGIIVKLMNTDPHPLKTMFDGSALITGILLALNLPPSSPVWLVLVGSFAAIFIGKHVYGGLGRNPFNPALAARVILLVSFPVQMTSWHQPVESAAAVDVVTAATPLDTVKTDGVAAFLDNYETKNIFLGNIAGSLGETCVPALLLGALILFVCRCITWEIPVTFIGTTMIVTGAAYITAPAGYISPFFHLISGGLILGAFFMATDMVTSPVTRKGQILFGCGCGLITAVIRLFGAYPEGVSFAILIMNGFTPLIDRFAKPKIFGKND